MVINVKGDRDFYTEDSEGTDECGLRVCITEYKKKLGMETVVFTSSWLFCATLSSSLFFIVLYVCVGYRNYLTTLLFIKIT